jgi:hypothetical protein
LLILPPFALLLVVAVFGVNAPFWDEWELVPFIDGVLERGPQFGEFFARHNEHRIFFPKIVFLFSALASNFNVKVNMYISWVLMLAMYACYLLHLKTNIVCKTAPLKVKRLFFGLAAGFCCFNIIQSENILWGFQTGFLMTAAFSVICFYCFSRWYTGKKFRYLFISMASGFIASFSSMQGLFIFPAAAGVVFLLFLSGEKPRLKYMLPLVILAIFTFTLYFYDYSPPVHHGVYFMKSPARAALSFFMCIGNIFPFRSVILYLAAGMLIFALSASLTVYLIIKKKVAEHIFPLCLIYFGCAFCASIALGRSGMGWQAVLASRYTTFSLFIPTGLALMAPAEFNNAAPLTAFNRLVKGSVSLILIVLLSSQCFVIPHLMESAALAKTRQAVLRDYKNQTLQTLQSLYPWPDFDSAYRAIGILEKNRWSVFSERQKRPAPKQTSAAPARLDFLLLRCKIEQ